MRLLLTVMFTLALSAGATAAQAPAAMGAPLQDAEASALLRAAFAANSSLTPPEVMDSVVEATSRGTDGQDIAVTLKSRGSALRTQIGNSGRRTSVTSGRTTHVAAGKARRVHDPNAPFRHAEHLPAVLLSNLLMRRDVAMQYHGQVQFDGATFLHVKVARIFPEMPDADEAFRAQLVRNSELNLYFDPATLLLTRITYPLISAVDWRRSITAEVRYADYRDFGGLVVPTRQTKFMNGTFFSTLTVTGARVNVGLAPADVQEGQ